MLKRPSLLIIGFIFSHLVVTITLAFFYQQNFYLFSPFNLLRYYFSAIGNYSISPFLLVLTIFYLFSPFIPVAINNSIDEENFKKNNKYGYARFAQTINLIKKMGFNFEQGIVFGLLKQGFFRKPKLIRTKEPLSTLLMAPPGTGKTAGIIIPTLLALDNSVVVHDPKGELFDITSKTRQKKGQKILVFDIDDPASIQFNPFATNKIPKEVSQIKPYIVNISNIIFKSSNKEDANSYFVGAARNAFIATACFLIYRFGFTSPLRIRDKILENDDVITTFKSMKEEELDLFEISDKKLHQMLERDINSVLIASHSPAQWAGVMGSLAEKLDYFSDPKIANIVDCEISSFVASDLRKEKITIYLKVKDKDRNKLKPVISMIFETLGTELISAIPDSSDNQVTFILDEFVRLGKVDVLAELSSISRGYNFNQVFVIQDLEQISNTYGKEYMSILESNCAYKVILKQNNFMTAERISKIIGLKTEIKTSKSQKEAGIISKNNHDSVSTSQEGISLVTPQDILNLNQNQCLIISQGFAASPILADICWWWKNKKSLGCEQ